MQRVTQEEQDISFADVVILVYYISKYISSIIYFFDTTFIIADHFVM